MAARSRENVVPKDKTASAILAHGACRPKSKETGPEKMTRSPTFTSGSRIVVPCPRRCRYRMKADRYPIRRQAHLRPVRKKTRLSITIIRIGRATGKIATQYRLEQAPLRPPARQTRHSITNVAPTGRKCSKSGTREFRAPFAAELPRTSVSLQLAYI